MISSEKINKVSNGSDKNNIWESDGLCFPEGTKFRGKYKGYFYPAKVENGFFVLNKKEFLTFSAAAVSITRADVINGLFFWECKPEENGSWKSIISILKNS